MPDAAQPVDEDRLWLAPMPAEPGLFADGAGRSRVALHGVIHGWVPSMKNSREIGWAFKSGGGKRAILRLSPMAQKFKTDFKAAAILSDLDSDALPLHGVTTIEDWKKGRHDRLVLNAVMYVDTLIRDVDVELLKDVLQDERLIENDRGIWETHVRREVDELRPRVEFTVHVTST